MALITEKDRIQEFENIKSILQEVDVAAEVLKKGSNLEQSCMVISMPTAVEEWKEEFQEDLHVASAYLTQLGEDEEQLTKYLVIYMPIQVDVSGVDELTILKFVNDSNMQMPVGTCFYCEDPKDGRMLVQVKWSVGGRVDELLDEGVICEAVYELGYAYDMLKEHLLEMVK